MEKSIRQNNFTKEFINFFSGTIFGSKKFVEALIEIEKNFFDDYRLLKIIQFDPNEIDKMMKDMSEEEKETILLIYTKASLIGKKFNNLFDLSLAEKENLVSDLNNFENFVNLKLTKLNLQK